MYKCFEIQNSQLIHKYITSSLKLFLFEKTEDIKDICISFQNIKNFFILEFSEGQKNAEL